MRKTIFLIALFILKGIIAAAQLQRLSGTWVSKNGEVLVVDTNQIGNSILIAENLEEQGQFSQLKLVHDTLILRRGEAMKGLPHYTIDYNLKLLSQNDTEIILCPASEAASRFLGGATTMSFVREEYFKSKPFTFQKLVFHTSFCYGECPTVHMLIDSAGGTFLNREIVYKGAVSDYTEDKKREGLYKGKLSQQNLDTLTRLLSQSNVLNIPIREATCCDGALKTVIIYFDAGRRRYIHSMFLPHQLDNLIEYLYQISLGEWYGFQSTDNPVELEK